MSVLPTPFPPLDSLTISLGECCIPLQEKKIKQFQASVLLHTLLAFGSLQQIHKTDHTRLSSSNHLHFTSYGSGMGSHQVSPLHLLTVKRGARPYMCSLK